MAYKILSLGDPGSGKTTAAESLDPKTTFIICCDKKGLPFKNWKINYKTVLKDNGKLDLTASNYYETSNPSILRNLIKAISEQHTVIKTIIIDTMTAMMENEYMSKAKEKGLIYQALTHLIDWNTLIVLSTPYNSNDYTIVKKIKIGQSAAKHPSRMKVQRLSRKRVLRLNSWETVRIFETSF
jgi:hypothetical protein